MTGISVCFNKMKRNDGQKLRRVLIRPKITTSFDQAKNYDELSIFHEVRAFFQVTIMTK
jgi:hypothetical protein